MKKIKYLLKRIKNMNFKNMFHIANQISKKTKKWTICILFDMVYCGFIYGAGYMDYFEFEFYLLNRKERKTYLTATLNNKIINKYNQKEYMNQFSDKLIFNEIFKDYLHHEFLDLKKASFEEFKKFCQKKSQIVGKVVDSCGGKGIDIYDLKDYKDLKKLYELLKEKNQFLVEEKIKQHKKMNELYDGSVNTLRMITFLKEDGSAVLLNTILRIGNGGKVDNFSSGGMYTFVSEKGTILIPAIDELGRVFETHPITKEKFVGFEIPNFEEIKEFVCELAKVIPEVRYVGWDIAVGEKEPILIEGNEFCGIFQMKPSLSSKKEGVLPKYREYMDI